MLTKDVETMAGAAQGKADICEHYPVKFLSVQLWQAFLLSLQRFYPTYPLRCCIQPIRSLASF